MTISLTRFYQLMEADYQRMMEIVEAGPYATHSGVLKIKALNPAVLFEKGKNLESLAASISITKPMAVFNLKSDGELVESLTKEIEKTVTLEVTQPIHKAMLRFILKYVKRVSEGWVVPESEVIRLKFSAKQKEATEKFNKMSEMLRQANAIEEIKGVIEALKEDLYEVELQESKLKKVADARVVEKIADDEAFEIISPLKLNKCLEVFKGVESQVDYFVYQWFLKEVPEMWEDESSQIFQAPATNKIPFPVKKVNNEALKIGLETFVSKLLNTDDILKKVWEGEKIGLFQQLWSVTDNQKKCQKMAMALYCKKMYIILDQYESGITEAFKKYQNPSDSRSFSPAKITDIKSLLTVFCDLFISEPSQNARLEKAWKDHVEFCESLFKTANQTLMLANGAVLDKLEEYGFDRLNASSVLGKGFMDLNQNIEELLNPTFDEEPQWGGYHPFYADKLEEEKKSTSTLPNVEANTKACKTSLS